MPIERFMIVDEVEANALFFTVVLNELGYKQVATARTGAEALDEASRQSVHFVLAAWEMQTMSGTTLVQRLRSGKKKHIPYVIYSKRLTPEDLTLSRELGLKNLLSLPLEREKAKAEIKAAIDAEAAVSPEEARLRKIELYLAENKPSEALRLVDAKLTKKGPDFVRAQGVVGQVWFMVGQYAKAEEAVAAALAADPADFTAANLMATIYSRTGRHEQAIEMLNKMTAASPKNLTSLLSLGSAYVDADRPDDAKKTFAAISALDPDNPDLKDEKGKLAFKEGDLPLAAQLLAETQNGDSLARQFNNMAIALTHQQKFDRAIETYENAIKLLSSKAKMHALHYNLGLALAKKGELERSFAALVMSYKSDPSFEKAYAAIARVSKQMTEKGQAYDKALAREVNEIRKRQKAAPANKGAA